MSDENKHYKVGYKKPPKENCFPKGKSGNPKGRPLGRKVIKYARLSGEALLHAILDEAQKPIDIRENGEDWRVPAISAIIKGLVKDALTGDRFARRDFIKLTEMATREKDKIYYEMMLTIEDLQERKLKALNHKGSLEHFDVMYQWFMFKRSLRRTDGDDCLEYEDDEPLTDEDWKLFLSYYEQLKMRSLLEAPWPLDYPSKVSKNEV